MCLSKGHQGILDVCAPLYKAEIRERYTEEENAIFDTMIDHAVTHLKDTVEPLRSWREFSVAVSHFWYQKITPGSVEGWEGVYQNFSLHSYISKHIDLAQTMLHKKSCHLWDHSIDSHMFAFQSSCLEELLEPANQWFIQMLALGCPAAGYEKRSREDFVEGVYSQLTEIRRGNHCTHWDGECYCFADSHFVAEHWEPFVPIFEGKRKALEKAASQPTLA